MSEQENDVFDESYFADFSNADGSGSYGEEDNFLDMYHLTPRQRLMHSVKKVSHKFLQQYQELPGWQRVVCCIGGVCVLIAGVLLLVFHDPILHKVVEVSNELKEDGRTPFALVGLLFVVAFPPMIGFSLLGTITGLVYEVSFEGWVVMATGAVTGSIASFVAFKTILHSRAESLIHSNRRFEAFALILQENNSYWILALLRLCPFPYSLTNGAMAAVYGLSIRNFAIAQIITTPKLLIYLFIGSRIKNMGETNSTSSKLLNFLSIVVTMVILTVTAWVLYLKTQKKYLELQRSNQGLDSSPHDDTMFDQSFDI